MLNHKKYSGLNPNIDEIYNKVSIRLGVPKQEVEEIIDHIFKSTREAMRDSTPKILIHDFGTFVIKPTKLIYKINKIRTYLEKGYKTEKSKQRAIVTLNKLEEIVPGAIEDYYKYRKKPKSVIEYEEKKKDSN